MQYLEIPRFVPPCHREMYCKVCRLWIFTTIWRPFLIARAPTYVKVVVKVRVKVRVKVD
jgi:hypothetical protein